MNVRIRKFLESFGPPAEITAILACLVILPIVGLICVMVRAVIHS